MMLERRTPFQARKVRCILYQCLWQPWLQFPVPDLAGQKENIHTEGAVGNIAVEDTAADSGVWYRVVAGAVERLEVVDFQAVGE